MRVLCIDDKNSIGGKSQSYTKGRWYDVTHLGFSPTHHMFYIKADNGLHPAVERKNFITLEEHRSIKLSQIGI